MDKLAAADVKDGPVLLYDGVCGLCNKTVQIILSKDRKGILRFAALQSDFGKEAVSRHSELRDVDSVVWVESDDGERERVFIKSRAALKVMNYLGGLWKGFLILYIVPTPIRDIFYNLVARYRYRIFGKYDTCLLPDAKVRARFIDVV